MICLITPLLLAGCDSVQAQTSNISGAWYGPRSQPGSYPYNNTFVTMNIEEHGESISGDITWFLANDINQFVEHTISGTMLHGTLHKTGQGRTGRGAILWCEMHTIKIVQQNDGRLLLSGVGKYPGTQTCPFWTALLTRGDAKSVNTLDEAAVRLTDALEDGTPIDIAKEFFNFAYECGSDQACRDEILSDPRLESWAKVQAIVAIPLFGAWSTKTIEAIATRRALAGVAEGVAASTGRTEALNLAEQLAMQSVKANPMGGITLTMPMKDPRWPASAGWEKMQQIVNGVRIHYNRNKFTGQVADFKFKD